MFPHHTLRHLTFLVFLSNAVSVLPRILVSPRPTISSHLSESIDDEDEVLLAIAENIGELLDAVGGPEFYHTLLSPLELLAVVEDSSVRDAVS